MGNLNDTMVDLVAGGSVVYTAVCDIDVAATGTLSNTAMISSAIMDPDGANNSATDNDTVLIQMADVSVTKTDGVTSAMPGGNLTYTIVAANAGPNLDPAVSLNDTLPADLTCTYTSVASGGATGNTPAGAGDLTETLSMPAASSVTYTLFCTIDIMATGTLSNTATVAGSLADPDAGNNSATDADTALSALVADVSVTKTSNAALVTPGGMISYTIVAQNNGPDTDPAAVLTDTLPADLTCTYTSAAAGGATGNTAAAAGDIMDTLFMPNASSVTYTLNCTVDAAAIGTLVNIASLAGSVTDPTPANDSATASSLVSGFAEQVPVNAPWAMLLLIIMISMIALLYHRQSARVR